MRESKNMSLDFDNIKFNILIIKENFEKKKEENRDGF